ncbi:MAG: NAD(P) transhydrogenase subunit alpha [Oscillospiraceae bacterium]|nr:NAD(P) transhydrogenase subunit alpha [Oscillospiraceae bacterium]
MIFLLLVFILIIAAFLGKELIPRKLPSRLHTAVMSAINAISGIAILGALIICATSTDNIVILILSMVAICLATINLVGGFVLTERLLTKNLRMKNKN